MKKSILVLLVLFSIKYSAQTYVPFSDSVSTCNVFFQQYPGSPIPWNSNISFQMEGDTILGSMTYKKVYQHCSGYSGASDDIICALREDTLKNVWLRQFPPANGTACDLHSFQQDTVAILLYSFGDYSPGDTIFAENNDLNPFYVVQSVDSILINGVNRLVYEVWGLGVGTDIWVSGIGSLRMLLSPVNTYFEWEGTVTCYEDESISWLNPEVDSCILPLAVGINENELNIHIYPNPVINDLIIKSDNKILGYSLYDLSGKLLMHSISSNKRIQFNQYDSGIYIVEVRTGKGVSRKRVIKE